MPSRDPIIYVIYFIITLIVLATGLLFYFRFEIEKTEGDLRSVRRELSTLGENSGYVSGLLQEFKNDKARGSNQAAGYIRKQALRYASISEGAVQIIPGKEERNKRDGYKDVRYTVKIDKRDAVARTQVLAWLYAIENETYGVKVTNLTLTPASRENDDRWVVQMTVVQRDSWSG